jgi:uncharacterized membrane protein YbhN (UPF0104 family)
LSFIFLLINFLIFVQGWRAIIHGLGADISFTKAFWVISSSQIAKYIPGGIWFALGRVYLGKGEKLRGEVVAMSVIIETCLTLLVGILLFLLSVNLANERIRANFLALIPIVLLFLFILYPPILNYLLRISLRIFRRPPVTLAISYKRVLGLSGYFLGLWIAQIIGFHWLINAIYPLTVVHIFKLTAAYTLSWITGFVVVIAPGGLGVREGMMTLLLSSILPTPLAIAISFLARVWITVFEAIVFFVGLIIQRRTRVRPAP